MGNKKIKTELIEWLKKLDDNETLGYLKVIKDNQSGASDWWDSLAEKHKRGIEQGLKDIREGRVVPHEFTGYSELFKKHVDRERSG